MTSIARRARQILYHRYPDGWLHAGFAAVFGTALGILAPVCARSEAPTSHFFLIHVLPAWILSIGFFAGALALLTGRRWGLLLLGVIYAVITIWCITISSVLFAVCFGVMAWSYFRCYRHPCG